MLESRRDRGRRDLLGKAEESFYGALSELTNRRYNNCASRCYYASFQAAIYALSLAGIEPPGGPESQWGHAFVQSQFAGQLIIRRKVYSAEHRDTLSDNMAVRRRADYRAQRVTERQAPRAVRRTRELLEAVRAPQGPS